MARPKKVRAYPRQPRRKVSHGELHDKANKRWCGVCERWLGESKWDKHKMCDLVSKKAGGHGLRKGRKSKRTSKVIHYCIKHGPFVGFQWGGHRRVCRAQECSKEAYQASEVRAMEKGAKVEPTSMGLSEFQRACMALGMTGNETRQHGHGIIEIKTVGIGCPIYEVLSKLLLKAESVWISRVNNREFGMGGFAGMVLSAKQKKAKMTLTINYLKSERQSEEDHTVDFSDAKFAASTAVPMAESITLRKVKNSSHAFIRSEDILLKAGQTINQRLEAAQKVLEDLEQQQKDISKKVDVAEEVVRDLEVKRGNFYGKMEELAKEVT